MYFRVSSSDLQDILFESSFPIEAKEENGVAQHAYHLQHAIMGGSFSAMWFEGVHVSYGSASIYRNTEINVESNTPIMEMLFNLQGERAAYLNGALPGKERRIQFQSHEHNIMYLPPFDGAFQIEQQSATQVIKIALAEAYFKRLESQDSPIISRMCEMVAKQQMAIIGKYNLPMTAQMNLIIHDIMHCNRQGIYKRLLLESKVLELLMLQVEQFEQASGQKHSPTMKPGDTDKLYAAKLVLEQNMATPPTLWQLARQVGLNDFKLKNGFKALFGTTVFDYLHDLRMHQARQMLLDTDSTVYEVSEKIGYKHPHHFTAAFKKRFGILPSELRK